MLVDSYPPSLSRGATALVAAFLMALLRASDQLSFGLERDGGILADDFLVRAPHSENFTIVSKNAAGSLSRCVFFVEARHRAEELQRLRRRPAEIPARGSDNKRYIPGCANPHAASGAMGDSSSLSASPAAPILSRLRLARLPSRSRPRPPP